MQRPNLKHTCCGIHSDEDSGLLPSCCASAAPPNLLHDLSLAWGCARCPRSMHSAVGAAGIHFAVGVAKKVQAARPLGRLGLG